MHRREALDRLHFDDESAAHEKIGPKPFAQEHTVIFDVDELLPLDGHSQPNQAGFEHRLVDGLEQAGPEIAVNFKAAIDRQPRTVFNVGHKSSIRSTNPSLRFSDEMGSCAPIEIAACAEQQLQKTHLYMSIFAVEISCADCQMRCGSEMAPDYKDVKMRIVETGVAGVIALASQFLIVAAVLL